MDRRLKKTKKDFYHKKDAVPKSRNRDYLRSSDSRLDQIPSETFDELALHDGLQNPREQKATDQLVRSEEGDVAEEIEVLFDQPNPRRRVGRGRGNPGRPPKKRAPAREHPVEDTLTSVSLLRSPPSPPRSPPSPPRSPPSPPRQFLPPHSDTRQVEGSTYSQILIGPVGDQIVELLAPRPELPTTAEEDPEVEPQPQPVPLPEEHLKTPNNKVEPVGQSKTKLETTENVKEPTAEKPLEEPKNDAGLEPVITAASDGTSPKTFPASTSEPNFGSTRTMYADIKYSQYRREGEGFLDMEFVENDDKKTPQSLNNEIVVKAKKIKKLVVEKRMGLPKAYSDEILSLADNIIASSEAEVVYYRKKLKRKEKPPEKLAKNIINIAERSEGILKIVKSAKEQSSSTGGDPGREAAEHLEKMVKKLHCRHRMLKRLAEEIIAKRWKLQNIAQGKQGTVLKGDGTAKQAAQIRRKIRKRERKMRCGSKRKSKKRTINEKELKLVYSNPMAKLKSIAKTYGGPETWKEDDPLSKILNRVGVEIIEKCVIGNEEPQQQPLKRVIRLPSPVVPVVVKRKTGVFPSPQEPDLTAHFGKSALTIFVSNYSKLAVVPSHKAIPLPEKPEQSFRMMSIDKAELTNNFVDVWKRRSYAVGIFLIIFTALLQCAYLCGPRMGDNYVTNTMVQSLSGWPKYTPTGIYGLIFLGYLFGGMTVIKTASAAEHNMTVKAYFKERKIKFFIWYMLVFYFCIVWIARCCIWYTSITRTEHEMHAIFNTKFYYNQISSRMLYTQFLFSCCGANGPGDYPEGPNIGWPKSCYVRVNEYEEYYDEPKPIEYGCSSIVYTYSTMGLAVICSLCLIILVLALLQPAYLYVYELFICMRSKEPEPWLEYSKN